MSWGVPKSRKGMGGGEEERRTTTTTTTTHAHASRHTAIGSKKGEAWRDGAGGMEDKGRVMHAQRAWRDGAGRLGG